MRGVTQGVVRIIGEAKALAGKIAAKNTHSRTQIFAEFAKREMQLQRSPKPLPRFLFGLRADQEVQLVAVLGEEPRSKVTAQVAGRAGYEDRHKRSDGDTAWETAAPRPTSSPPSISRAPR